jgi:hypothetical protein
MRFRKWRWLGDMKEGELELYKIKVWLKSELKSFFFGKDVIP